MFVTIRLVSGPSHDSCSVSKYTIQKNIDALQRAIDGKPLCADFVLLIDTKSILETIQKELPK